MKSSVYSTSLPALDVVNFKNLHSLGGYIGYFIIILIFVSLMTAAYFFMYLLIIYIFLI